MNETMHRSAGRYFFWDGALLYAGAGGRSAFHSHHLIQIGISEERSIKVRTERDEPYVRSRGFLLDADVPHQVVCASRRLIYFLWIDPESDRARRLYAARPDLSGRSVLLDSLRIENWRDGSPPGCADAERIRNTVLAQLGVKHTDAVDLDERVETVIQRIRGSLQEETPSVESLAELAFLSPSRLMHLFRDQVGIPIRRYVLWQRIMAAIRYVLAGANLSEAAVESGFADSAHMSRTFKDMFGVTPSSLFKNSRFVQAIDCSSA